MSDPWNTAACWALLLTVAHAAPAPEPIAPLTRIGWPDRAAYGAKAAGVAELGRVPGVHAPAGFAVPCQAYRRFMRASGLEAVAQKLVRDPAFLRDPHLRKAQLKALRRQIRAAPLPADLTAALEAMQASFPRQRALRCRPSPAGEDLEAWLGSTLYDAKTHRPDEGSIVHTIRQVWASLWTLRAYQARASFGLDHATAAMGVLVHPHLEGAWATGDAAVSHEGDPRRQAHAVRVESRAPERTPLSIDQRIVLDRAMRAIHVHFARLHGDPPHLDLDLEFKVDADQRLVFKEARPRGGQPVGR